MKTPKTTAQLPKQVENRRKPPKKAVQRQDFDKRAFRDILEPDHKSTRPKTLHERRFPNSVRGEDPKRDLEQPQTQETETALNSYEIAKGISVKSVEKTQEPNDVRSISREIVQEVVVLQNRPESAEVVIHMNVAGAALSVRVKTHKHGVEIRLRTKNAKLRKTLREQKSEIASAMEGANVSIRSLTIR